MPNARSIFYLNLVPLKRFPIFHLINLPKKKSEKLKLTFHSKNFVSKNKNEWLISTPIICIFAIWKKNPLPLKNNKNKLWNQRDWFFSDRHAKQEKKIHSHFTFFLHFASFSFLIESDKHKFQFTYNLSMNTTTTMEERESLLQCLRPSKHNVAKCFQCCYVVVWRWEWWKGTKMGAFYLLIKKKSFPPPPPST